MTTNREIYQATTLLIKQHGDEAPIYAAIRANELMEAGDKAIPGKINGSIRPRFKPSTIERCRRIPNKWIGTAAGLAGALVIALNLPFSGWGFGLFFVSSTTWLAAGILQRDTALAVLSVGYTAVNVLGIITRWLIV